MVYLTFIDKRCNILKTKKLVNTNSLLLSIELNLLLKNSQKYLLFIEEDYFYYV